MSYNREAIESKVEIVILVLLVLIEDHWGLMVKIKAVSTLEGFVIQQRFQWMLTQKFVLVDRSLKFLQMLVTMIVVRSVLISIKDVENVMIYLQLNPLSLPIKGFNGANLIKRSCLGIKIMACDPKRSANKNELIKNASYWEQFAVNLFDIWWLYVVIL